MINKILIFAAGVAIGSAVTWKLVKDNEDVETRYEKGIASTMETYRKPVKYLTCPQCKNEIVLKAVR